MESPRNKYTKLLYGIINNSTRHTRRLQRAAPEYCLSKEAFELEVLTIVQEITEHRLAANLYTEEYYTYPLVHKLWNKGSWKKTPPRKTTGGDTATKLFFRLINESRSICIRLAYAAHVRSSSTPNKTDFIMCLSQVIKGLAKEYGIRPSEISESSLRSNQWRYGKWLKIPEAERNYGAYNNAQADENKNQTINSDEVHRQKDFSTTKETTKESDTQIIFRLINENRAMCIKLATATNKNGVQDKRVFAETLAPIVTTLKCTHKITRIFTASLVSNQFRYGKWRKIPKHERNYKSFEAALKAGGINKDELAAREKRSLYLQRFLPRVYIAEKHNYVLPSLEQCIEQIQPPNKKEAQFTEKAARTAVRSYKAQHTQIAQQWAAYHQCADWGEKAHAPHGKFGYAQCGAELHKQIQEYVNIVNSPKKEYNMEIKTQTLIDGKPVEELEDSQLIHLIGNMEDRITRRKKLKTQSKRITADIEKMEAQCIQLAGFLDART